MKPHTVTKTHSLTRKLTLPFKTSTNTLTDRPVLSCRLKQKACCVDVCSPLDLVGGGEVSPKTSLDHWERRCLPPLAQSHKLLSGFADFGNYFLQVIQRDWGEILSQRMLPQVIRILYVLSFCFFQGGFIRWGALTFIVVCVVRVIFSLISCLILTFRQLKSTLYRAVHITAIIS